MVMLEQGDEADISAEKTALRKGTAGECGEGRLERVGGRVVRKGRRGWVSRIVIGLLKMDNEED